MHHASGHPEDWKRSATSLRSRRAPWQCVACSSPRSPVRCKRRLPASLPSMMRTWVGVMRGCDDGDVMGPNALTAPQGPVAGPLTSSPVPATTASYRPRKRSGWLWLCLHPFSALLSGASLDARLGSVFGANQHTAKGAVRKGAVALGSRLIRLAIRFHFLERNGLDLLCRNHLARACANIAAESERSLFCR